MPAAIVALALILSTSAATRAETLGEACHGTETIQVDAGPARPAPFDLSFSVDLKSGLYCYGACTREQTFAIRGATPDQIQLADVHGTGQTREIVFDRKAATLTDDQVIHALATVTRHARAICTPAPFHQPPALSTR